MSNSSNSSFPAQFIPWGGFVSCDVSEQNCDQLALEGQSPGFLSTCVLFSGDSIEAEGVPLAGIPEDGTMGYCVCNINYARSGNSCEDADHLELGYAIIPNILLLTYVSFFLLRTLHRANREGLLVPSAATTTTIVTTIVSLLVQVWVYARMALYLGAPESIYPVNLFFAAICAGCITVNMMVVTLVFQAVQASTKKMRKGSGGDGISSFQKKMVAGASIFVIFSVTALVFAGQTRLASVAAMVYVIICFIFYVRAASNMKALLKSASTSNSSGGPNLKAQQAFGRILKLINQIIAFVCVFIPAALMYSRTSTDQKASSLSPNAAAYLGLYLMHFSGSVAVFCIGIFAAGPLLTKVRVQREGQSAMSTSQSTSVAPA